MFLNEEKILHRAHELGSKRYTDFLPPLVLTSMEGELGHDDIYRDVPKKIEGKPITVGDYFIGRDRYLWLEQSITLPPAREGHDLVGIFDFGKTGGGNNSGFESLLYLNGKPYQGVDTNHKDVILNEYAGQAITLTFLLWTGLEGGGAPREQHHQIKQAGIGYLNHNANKLYYLLRMGAETLPCLSEDSTERTALMQALNRAVALLDFADDSLFQTVDASLEQLENELAAISKKSDVTVHTIGHTHIDVAWLWRLKHTREKAQRSFSTVLKLMNEYDEYLFLQSQPQLYHYIKDDCPALYEQMKLRIKEGRWEADGGMWLEADCNVISGESMVRQFVHGITFLKEEFGVDCKYLWLPDVFGYSWALPQIMKLCGLDSFMTTKISWNQYNSIPNDLFYWRGIDGSEIMTYFIQTPEPGRVDKRMSTYNGVLTPYTVSGAWKRFKNKELTNDLLISYGYGDGGGGVNREMLECRRALDAMPGLPHVKTTRADEFFQKVHSDLAKTDSYIPVWDGELYLEYHRGTYTTQANNKKHNRKLEFALCEIEWMSSMALLNGGCYDKAAMDEAWKVLLCHQFHDIIPGSSIREVYEDSDKAYAKIQATVDSCKSKLAEHLIKPSADKWSILDFGSFAHDELVLIPEARGGKFTDDAGNVLESQKADNGTLVLTKTGALSQTVLQFTPDTAAVAASAFNYDEQQHHLTTPFYQVTFHADGSGINSIFDVTAKREVLQGKGNILRVYEDKPLGNDAWDIDLFYLEKYEDIKAVSTVLAECGNLRCIIQNRYKYRNSIIEQDVVFYSHTQRIDFITRVEWAEERRLLRTLFETNIRSTKATYDIQYGYVERPTHWNTSWDVARFEVCGHKWADISEANYGVSLLNDCKYGYSVHDGVMGMSLLRSPKHPDTHADMGTHSFTYSLYPHMHGLIDGGTIEEGVALNQPPVVLSGVSAYANKQLVRVDSSAVIIDAVKPAEDNDGFVVRLHECRGGRCEINLTSDLQITGYAESNLLEAYTERTSGSEVAITLKPFEIKNIRLWF